MWEMCTTVGTIHSMTKALNTSPRRGWPFVGHEDLEMNGYSSWEKMWRKWQTLHPQIGTSFQTLAINTLRTCWMASVDDITMEGQIQVQCLLWAGSSTKSVQRLHGEKKGSSFQFHYPHRKQLPEKHARSIWSTNVNVHMVPQRPTTLRTEERMGNMKSRKEPFPLEDLRVSQEVLF